jgi:hypothetical protein
MMQSDRGWQIMHLAVAAARDIGASLFNDKQVRLL